MKHLFILILFLFIPGCSLWENFTVYFNLYYNTIDLFEQAETSIKEQTKDLFAIDDPPVPGTANQQLNKVIEKASRILQFYPTSSFVDDALLILGKSFYYQKNHPKALRKFQELIATQPESNLILEAELWIGKSQMRLRYFEDGLSTLKLVREKAIEQGEDKIVDESFIEEIKYFVWAKDYESAIYALNAFVELSSDNEISAKAMYELGLLYIEIEDLQNAIAAFERVSNYSPVYEIELNSNLELAKTLREADENERALSIFERMKAEDKYKDSYDLIDLERGKTLASLGRFDEAIEILSIVDTTYPNLTSSGEARYRIGEIYEKNYKQFDSAAVYFGKVMGAASPPGYTKRANEKTQLFRKYKTLNEQVAELKKQLVYIEDPEEFVKDSIAFYSDTLKTEEEALDRDQPVFDDREREPNIKAPPVSVAQQPKLEEKKPPQRPTISADSIKHKLAEQHFHLGNLFFTEFNLLDSAHYYYSEALEKYSGSNFQARILFALASYYLTVDDKEKADSLFSFIYENYRDESIVNAAANKLNKPLVDLEFDPAKEIYAEAEQQMLQDDLNTSLKNFYDIFMKYPESKLAPKALMASGWILENKLKLYDSAAVMYDSIATKYPATVYATAINPKLTLFKQERAAKLKVIEDSLRQIRMRDSLAADSLNKLKAPVKDSTKFDKKVEQSKQPELNIELVPQDSIKTAEDSIRAIYQQLFETQTDEIDEEPERNNGELKPDSIRTNDVRKPPG
jgi:TolA-binding protein